MMNLRRAGSIAVALAVVALGVAPMAARAAPPDKDVIASFEGGWLDLAHDWGPAHACYSDNVSTRCYRTKAEMDAVEGRNGSVNPLVSCSSPLTLYSDTEHGGNTVSLSTRGTYLALSTYGFDNVTSSYQIGACSAHFYDTSTGGTTYPGTTTAGSSALSMVSGWDNRVSSVYIA
jgi:hypothetical protein